MTTTAEQRKIRQLLEELRDFVTELVRGKTGELSTLDQLRELVTTKGSKLNGGSSGKSRSLININAYDLLQQAKRDWGNPPERGLRATLAGAEQCGDIAEITAALEAVRTLAQSIRDTLDPPRRMHLRDGQGRAAACPRCGARTFKRRDQSGQEVLGPVLAIDETVCVCLSCRASWPPRMFEWLARVITPDGPSQAVSGDLSACEVDHA